jgi:hypothetical protein
MKLEKYRLQDLFIEVKTRYNDQQQFLSSVRIGINRENKTQIPVIRTFIESLDPGIRLGKIKTMKTGIVEINKLLILPQLASLKPVSSVQLAAPTTQVHVEEQFAHILLDNAKTTPFGIEPSDLAQGGIICGAIGTGKTTLRLHLMKILLSRGVRVIDFDLKGDAPRYLSLGTQGLVIQPNTNFYLNPFACPAGYSSKEYSEILLRVFLDALPDHESLTPPQKHLLAKSTEYTVQSGGNARNFMANMLMLSHQSKEIIDNYQEQTGQSLLVKFAWMQSVLGDIFWREQSNLSEPDFKEYNLFFDFSVLMHTVPHKLIRFLMDVITTRIMASLRHKSTEQGPKLVIFIDEAQILMPRSKISTELSRLEETLATLRYKGVSVLATGIAAGMMSRVLLDTGFVAQFRSESEELLRGLGLFSHEEKSYIPQLNRFTCILRCQSTGPQSVHIAVRDFPDMQSDPDKYQQMIKLQYLPAAKLLERFSLNFEVYWQSKIASTLVERMTINNSDKIVMTSIARHFVTKYVEDRYIEKKLLEEFVGKLYAILTEQLRNNTAANLVAKYPQQFLLLVIEESFLQYVMRRKNHPQLQQFERTFRSQISQAISLLDREMNDLWYAEIPQV